MNPFLVSSDQLIPRAEIVGSADYIRLETDPLVFGVWSRLLISNRRDNESGAIVEYLIDTYDVSHKLSYETFPEKYHMQQWLHFQMSGQGPYYSQLFWFKQQPTPELVAIKRYANEIRRVTGVLEKALEGRDWLVGDKCTYADLCLVPWQDLVPMYYAEEVGDILRDFPGVSAWMGRMKEREDVQKVMREKSEAMEKMAAQK
ncbi:unnamed protein product [Penicillium viridicatum]